MTRQELIDDFIQTATAAERFGRDTAVLLRSSRDEQAIKSGVFAGQAGRVALDHLSALEQQAITAYLAEVPLPEGWREERDGLGGREWPVVRYLEAVQGLDTPVERAFANKATIHVNTMPAHWPAIPQAVLVRAAVQCHRLREAGRA